MLLMFKWRDKERRTLQSQGDRLLQLLKLLGERQVARRRAVKRTHARHGVLCRVYVQAGIEVYIQVGGVYTNSAVELGDATTTRQATSISQRCLVTGLSVISAISGYLLHLPPHPRMLLQVATRKRETSASIPTCT